MKYRKLWSVWFWIINGIYRLYNSVLNRLGYHNWLDRGARFKIKFGMVSKDGEPKRCYKCANNTFTETIKDRIEGTVCEYESTCNRCKTINGYWAYGSWTWV